MLRLKIQKMYEKYYKSMNKIKSILIQNVLKETNIYRVLF